MTTSEKNIEDMATLKANHQHMNQKIDDLKIDIGDLRGSQKELHNKIDTFTDNLFDKLEQKYVQKSEFRLAVGVITAIATIIGILYYFIK